MIRAALAAIVAAAIGVPAALAADIRVISANGLADVIVDTRAQYENEVHHKLALNVVTSGDLVRRVLAGESFDVIIAPRDATAELEKADKIAPGTAVPLTRVGFGLAVAADGPRPDVSTPEALKRTLLAAKTVMIT